MSDHILSTPDEFLHFQLRTALSMEHDSLNALHDLAEAAKSRDIVKLFHHHADETQQQIENLSRVFQLLDIDETPEPSPSTKGISDQARALIRHSAPELHDRAVLSSALGNEHYEMGAYEALISQWRGLPSEALELLDDNLGQERHTSREIRDRIIELSH